MTKPSAWSAPTKDLIVKIIHLGAGALKGVSSLQGHEDLQNNIQLETEFD